jgi:hypothetical protein
MKQIKKCLDLRERRKTTENTGYTFILNVVWVFGRVPLPQMEKL